MTSPSPSDAIYDVVARRLSERVGLALASRRADVKAATLRAMRKAGVRDPAAYVRDLEDGRVSLSGVVDEVTVGETYFFREPEQFAFIRDVVVPDVLGRLRPEERLRAWSAGCASGEEAYSLAILFRELGLAERSRLVATDVASNALTRARRAEYSAWSLRGTEAPRALRHLRRDGGERFILDATIRESVTFHSLNLATSVYPSPCVDIFAFDLILCRNVLIYFDRDTVARTARNLFDSLRGGGWLVLGSSDPPLSSLAPFRPVFTAHGVFYQRPLASSQASAGPAGSQPPPPQPAPRRVARPVAPSASSALGPPRAAEPVAESTGVGTERELARVRALADAGRLSEALEAADVLIAGAPLVAEAHFVRAWILSELGGDPDSVDAFRRALYIDRTLVMAHLGIGIALARLGDARGAGRAFRRVRALCRALDVCSVVPESGGASPLQVAELAASHDRRLTARARKR